MPFPLSITEAEFLARRNSLLGQLGHHDLDGVVLFDPHYVLYYSGFAFMPTERPLALLIPATDKATLFVPRLEAEHAAAHSSVDHVEWYPEYPGEVHPMQHLASFITGRGWRRVGVDADGYPEVFGYRGPSLAAVSAVETVMVRKTVERQMMIKSASEVALLRESGRWAADAHQRLQQYTKIGVSETDVANRASAEATRVMLNEIGDRYRAQHAWLIGPAAYYRGQVGRNAAMPHSLSADIHFEDGDVLVTGATAPVWGYTAELERTMILGGPTEEQQKLFSHMVALQETAFGAIRPRASCASVELATLDYYRDNDLGDFWRHHVGHGIGLRYHEGPFFDRGDETILEPGMVITVEPGIYVPGLGGFRHSDTVVITDAGFDFITHYPRDLASLTLTA